MAFSVNTQAIIGAFLIVSLCIGVQSHSYVTSPQSRSNQKQSNTGCRGPNCLGPCDVPLSKRSASAAVHVAARGDSVTIQWPRNNHAGGFIRFAWAPTAQSDNHTAFDQHVQLISCHETGGCYPDSAADPNGGDSGPADGSSRACSQTFTIPADLADGSWTLQWAWFGGAFSLGDYYSCVDYTISGGASGSTPIPKFVGGDYSYPNQQKCKFFNTNKLHVCVNEACNNPIYPAAQQQSGAPAFIQENFPSVTPSPSTPTAPVTPVTPVTPVPSTTGAAQVTPVAPMTTGRVQTAPTPTVPPTVPVPVSSSSSSTSAKSSTSTSSSSSSDGSCVSGYMKCLPDGSYSTCNHELWGPAQQCSQGTSCSASGNYIYCLVNANPSPATPTAPTTPVTPTPTPTTPSSPIATGSCTLGYQQCVGSNGYQTCGNGRDGPVWAGVQYCQTGLSCHASATANNIYCY